MNALYYVSIVLISGIIMARIISKLNLPYVTGYLLGGIIIGPSFLNLVPKDISTGLLIISEMALGFIAYSIGSEFNIEYMKKLGKSMFLITLLESLGAVLMVFVTMFIIFKQPLSFSLILASIAATTAPAATIMVIRQYKAKGKLVDTLLPVVAIDDAIGIIVFGIVVSIAKQVSNSINGFSLTSGLLTPIWEIGAALVLGIVIGFVLTLVSRKAKGRDELLSIVIATICLSIGIANFLNISTLLLCMTIGAVISNISPNNMKVITITDSFTPPIYIMFFTLAGVELDIRLMKYVGLLGIGYIIARVAGKVLGAYLGCKLSNMPKKVQNYLGLTLIPQAGVAIGLSMTAQLDFPEVGAKVRTIILGATIVYELIGPAITKYALMKSGDIQLKNPKLQTAK
ncbi:cation:proton antiporter [Maledivibacter halophilus]|uniref:Kef-type K+ transport system, membrane component KefB n=1 Tax=Maledivibacter halophilus TaxID=36842 RepID=A0A1T5MNB6_9FIRM|nr:cation:proton antiporter [Maledivibacter halophilus]SKC89720.1 Kef-type K+ transport system, membrane component KefB [Maledivibacter halophilus]